MRKEKGFTMIELLATITILGILSIVAIGSVSYFIKNSKQNYYQSQRNNLISAAKSYYQANRSKLPKDIGTNDEVTYGDLKNSKYIGKLVASDRKTECNSNDTKVVVTKVDKNKYKYKSYLHCGEEKDTVVVDGGTVNFDVSLDKTPDTYIYHFNINCSNSEAKIQSYTYTILKNSYNYAGPITEKVGSVPVNTRSFSIDLNDVKKENTFDYTVSIVYKYKGSVKTFVKKDKLNLNDKKPPVCTLADPGRTVWAKTPQTLTFACTDTADSSGYASGCQNSTYKITIKSNADYNKYKNGFKIYDKAGNEAECKNFADKILLDLDPPKCPTVTGYIKANKTDVSSPSGLSSKIKSGDWTTKWVFTYAEDTVDKAYGIEGKGSGGIYYKMSANGATTASSNVKQRYRNVNAEGKSTVTYQVCDKLDNCTTNCSGFNVNIDRTPPTCGDMTGSSTSWINTTRTVGVKCKDSGSGCTQDVFKKDITDEVKTKKVTIQIKDNVGLTANCTNTYNIYIDKTKPKVSSWTKGSYNDSSTYKQATGKASDSTSGIKYYAISTSNTAKDSSLTWHDIGKNAASNTFSIGFQKSKSHDPNQYYYYVKDKAGNIAHSSNKVKQYKICQLTKYMRDAAVYKMTFNSNDCNNKRKKMNINNTKCYGYGDKYHNVYCYHNMTTKSSETNYGHSGNKTYIYYTSKDKCKRGIKDANTYVTQICNDGKFKKESDHPERFIIGHGNDGKEYQFHGFRFFEKSCTNSKFCDFSKYMGVWVHQPVSASAPAKYDASNTSSSATAACAKEFKSMSTNYDDYA